MNLGYRSIYFPRDCICAVCHDLLRNHCFYNKALESNSLNNVTCEAPLSGFNDLNVETYLLDNIAFVFVADCENPAPGNGTADTPVGTTYEDVAIIKCNDGYDLVGDTLISCLDGGNWSSSPSCAIKGSH